MEKIRITYFSDILCIWAYIAQARVDELVSEYDTKVELDYRLFSVFGHAKSKIERQWREHGGLPAYNQHVIKIAAEFEHIEVSSNIWLQSIPYSSLPSHLCLCAIRLAESAGKVPYGSFVKAAWRLRCAFFKDAQDISQRSVLRELLVQYRLPLEIVDSYIDSGEAFLALSEDMQLANEMTVRSSPTLIFNEDRQRLAGNVGYRIIEANIRELIDRPERQHSWC